MKVGTKQYRTIWVHPDDRKIIQIIDQCKLPHVFEVIDLKTVEDAAVAIKEMYVRGAGLIGATAGYGMYLAAMEAREGHEEEDMARFARQLVNTRPTAKNLEWAVERQLAAVAAGSTKNEKTDIAFETANAIADEDATCCRAIGEHGAAIIEEIYKKKNGEPINILTHCNAGWLAFVDHGTATAPIYAAHEKGIPVHVWVDETRPRSQGAGLTAWELKEHGVPHHLIVDNAGGHLMQHGMVDLCITGADRVTYTGDAANKIGTYLKALAAKDNEVPFYVAFPSSTFDWVMKDGLAEIPIEERDEDEVKYVNGFLRNAMERVLICPPETPAKNVGFDVTPGRLITGLITERGVCAANATAVFELYPEKKTDEGYVKFIRHRVSREGPHSSDVQAANAVRTALFSKKLIGMYPSGIGYGNISRRIQGSERFFITGSATGAKEILDPEDWCEVVSFDLDNNTVDFKGEREASSESMSHGAMYRARDAVQSVIHVHHEKLWQYMLENHYPKTPSSAAYGTPEMARAIIRVVNAVSASAGVFVMEGHREGVVAYGPDLDTAFHTLMVVYGKLGETD